MNSNDNKKSILLKSSDSFNKKIIKSKGNNKINFNETNEINFSDITNFSTSEKNKIKKQFRFKSPNPRPSRNIKNSKIIFDSESQNNNNNNIMQDFNFFTKKNSQIRQAHLKNNILKLNKMKNNMKTRTETTKNFLSIKYIKDSAKIKMHNNFKDRLIKSAEIIFKDEEYDY